MIRTALFWFLVGCLFQRWLMWYDKRREAQRRIRQALQKIHYNRLLDDMHSDQAVVDKYLHDIEPTMPSL